MINWEEKRDQLTARIVNGGATNDAIGAALDSAEYAGYVRGWDDRGRADRERDRAGKS